MRDRETAQNILLVICLVALGLMSSACNLLSTKKSIQRAQGFYSIGVKQSNLGQFRQALASLKRAEELNPDNYWIQEALGGTFHRMGQFKMALVHYKKALDIQPKSPRGNNNLGSVYISLGKWPQAIKYLNIALSNMLYQTPCFARANIAWAYHKLKNYKKADKYFALVVRTCPRVCQAHRLRGLAAHERKMHQQAKKSFQELRVRCKKYLPGYFFLARSYVALKEFDSARPLLRECVDKSDKYPQVQNRCRTLLSSLPRKKAVKPNPIAAPRKAQEKAFIYIKPVNSPSNRR